MIKTNIAALTVLLVITPTISLTGQGVKDKLTDCKYDPKISFDEFYEYPLYLTNSGVSKPSKNMMTTMKGYNFHVSVLKDSVFNMRTILLENEEDLRDFVTTSKEELTQYYYTRKPDIKCFIQDNKDKNGTVFVYSSISSYTKSWANYLNDVISMDREFIGKIDTMIDFVDNISKLDKNHQVIPKYVDLSLTIFAANDFFHAYAPIVNYGSQLIFSNDITKGYLFYDFAVMLFNLFNPKIFKRNYNQNRVQTGDNKTVVPIEAVCRSNVYTGLFDTNYCKHIEGLKTRLLAGDLTLRLEDIIKTLRNALVSANEHFEDPYQQTKTMKEMTEKAYDESMNPFKFSSLEEAKKQAASAFYDTNIPYSVHIDRKLQSLKSKKYLEKEGINQPYLDAIEGHEKIMALMNEKNNVVSKKSGGRLII